MSQSEIANKNPDKIYSVCEIISNDYIADGIYDMVLRNKQIAEAAKPGQFVNIYLDNGELLLPRPISICMASQSDFRIVYRVAGRGTEILSKCKAGGAISALAPLGNGYQLFPDITEIALVGGGIGIPPLLFLANEYKKHYPNIKINAILGYRSELFLVSNFEKICTEVFVSTDDGTSGVKGNVIELLNSLEKQFDVIYSCGPKIMLKMLAEYAQKHRVECYMSLEERMGCGFGACVGCVCSITENGYATYKKVCTDGPVFDSKSIAFE